MLNRLRALIRGQASAAAPGRDLKESAAGLLVEAALIDGQMDPAERREIEGALVRSFELTDAVAAGLVDEAEKRAHATADFHGFSRALNRELDHPARVSLLEALWRVVHSDGHVHDYESNLMRRIAGLLHVEDRDSGSARKRAVTS